MDQARLDELAASWQGVLRLRDWDVKVRMVRGRDMPIPDSQGACSWEIRKRQALISILDPTDYPDDTQWPQDVEQTLVHELLHLHFAPFDHTTGDADDVAREQAIVMIACALVGLKREKTGD